MRILVTAGPTREYLDDVRFISNPSTGRMGFACARAARRAGHRVTLVTGPVELPAPPGVRTVRVTDAREMRRAVLAAWPRVDAVIMTAAVGDYRPARRFRGKIRKEAGGLSIRLARNPDILKELGARKGGRVLAGFALQVQDAEREALRKYEEKNLDLVVLNSPRSFGADRMDAAVYREGESVKRFRNASKEAVADWLVAALERILGERSVRR
jgi:phosphopantothenoylcysteine decarboxylase/phosphopantothenate--cysteine ligase